MALPQVSEKEKANLAEQLSAASPGLDINTQDFYKVCDERCLPCFPSFLIMMCRFDGHECPTSLNEEKCFSKQDGLMFLLESSLALSSKSSKCTYRHS